MRLLVTGGAGYIGSVVASNERARTHLGWIPEHPDVTTLVETAWHFVQERAA
jgi:UDP-glucose 4-epimerase